MRGLGVSKGLCYEKVVLYKEMPIVITDDVMSEEEENALFDEALQAVYEETVALREKALLEAGEDAAGIFDAHCTILKDDGMILPMKELIREGRNAAGAVDQVLSDYIRIFEEMEDEYLSLRALDIKDIKERLLRKILKLENINLSKLDGPTIIAGHDISPSTTAAMDIRNVAGILMELGGKTSHTAILARTLEIPAIVGIDGLLEELKDGDMVAFDGGTGEIFTSLAEDQIEELKLRQEAERLRKAELNKLINQDSITKDGYKVNLFGNIGNLEDVAKVLEKNADGIGLFRSEFLYLCRNDLPSEQLQFLSYKKVLQAMGDKPVIVRTLDIGGDKEVPALALKKEENPFLGLRAIRLCKEMTGMFKLQVRALLRASVYGNLHIMFPMISSIDELRWAKSVVWECREELQREGIAVKENIPIGIMVEIPSVAVMASFFAKECDFFSIGTNDLTQYTLAVDRGNDAVSDLYTNFHPGVIHLISNIIEAAHSAGIPCGMCGEAAGNPKMLPLLIGLQLDEFSMTASSILEVKELIKELSVEECKEAVKKAMNMETASQIENMLEEFIQKRRKT
jgi:phosphotransferase system enzyme I (PtsI)